jgi:hypothetical protein
LCPGRNNQNALIHTFFVRLKIKGNFREASDWLSRGKAIQPDGFSVLGIFSPVDKGVTDSGIAPPNGASKHLSGSSAREYYYFYLTSG